MLMLLYLLLTILLFTSHPEITYLLSKISTHLLIKLFGANDIFFFNIVTLCLQWSIVWDSLGFLRCNNAPSPFFFCKIKIISAHLTGKTIGNHSFWFSLCPAQPYVLIVFYTYSSLCSRFISFAMNLPLLLLEDICCPSFLCVPIAYFYSNIKATFPIAL